MSKYYESYSTRETTSHTPTEEIAIILNHLRLGTAKLQFYTSKNKVVDKINVLEPFFLRVSVWKGKYNKDGTPKYQFDVGISKKLFKAFLDSAGNRIDRFRYEGTDVVFHKASIFATKAGKLKQLRFFIDNYEAYEKDGFDWGNDYYGDNRWDDDRLTKWISQNEFFKQFKPRDVQLFGFRSFRKGMPLRYKSMFKNEFDFNPYLLNYMILKITEDGYVTPESIMQVFDGQHLGYFAKSISSFNRAKFFINIANSWTYIASVKWEGLSENYRDKLIKEILSFNPKAPTFLFLDFFKKRENMMYYLKNIFTDAVFTDADYLLISPDVVKLWADDEEICYLLHHSFNRLSRDISTVYQHFSDRVKLLPQFLNELNDNCFKHIPKNKLSDKEFLLKFLGGLKNELFTMKLLRAIPKVLREDREILGAYFHLGNEYEKELSGKVELPSSLFSHKFIQTCIDLGAKHKTKGEIAKDLPWILSPLDKDFERHTKDIVHGLIDYKTPWKLKDKDICIVWKSLPTKASGNLVKLKKDGLIEFRYTKSFIYLDDDLLEGLRRKKFADTLTVALEISKPIKGTTSSGRSKI
ncbi:hypothetical protein [Burkholderia cenocepacia]|uniref:hypothetical protein n=1 Tax=Burkholderia cenocepacia TaxID=95486 RepID=UPI00117791A3|nr:hypothetical protein [Burkholderia cenocepacia]